ncbi:MAG: type II toxin-antitoxin system mRNA interferase toxin, RelE/StbE family [bacterium]
MKIVTTDKYDKKYKKLSNNLKDKIDRALEKFAKDPFDPSLLNHGLQGGLNGFNSIKAGFDLRIILKEENGYILVLLIDLGKHDHVY